MQCYLAITPDQLRAERTHNNIEGFFGACWAHEEIFCDYCWAAIDILARNLIDAALIELGYRHASKPWNRP